MEVQGGDEERRKKRKERKAQEWKVTQWSLGLKPEEFTGSTNTNGQCSKYCIAKKRFKKKKKKTKMLLSPRSRVPKFAGSYQKNTKFKAHLCRWCTRSVDVSTDLHFSNWTQTILIHNGPMAGNHWLTVFPYWKKFWNIFIIIADNSFAKCFPIIFHPEVGTITMPIFLNGEIWGMKRSNDLTDVTQLLNQEPGIFGQVLSALYFLSTLIWWTSAS